MSLQLLILTTVSMLPGQVEQAPPVRNVVLMQAPPTREIYAQTYYDAVVEARRNRSPLVVFVNCKVLPVDGAAVCFDAECFGDATPRVIVSTWEGGKLVWKTDLPSETSSDAIMAVVASKITQRKEVRQEATPRPFRVQQITRSASRGGVRASSGSC